jgi:hypothetical protein
MQIQKSKFLKTAEKAIVLRDGASITEAKSLAKQEVRGWPGSERDDGKALRFRWLFVEDDRS